MYGENGEAVKNAALRGSRIPEGGAQVVTGAHQQPQVISLLYAQSAQPVYGHEKHPPADS